MLDFTTFTINPCQLKKEPSKLTITVGKQQPLRGVFYCKLQGPRRAPSFRRWAHLCVHARLFGLSRSDSPHNIYTGLPEVGPIRFLNKKSF